MTKRFEYEPGGDGPTGLVGVLRASGKVMRDGGPFTVIHEQYRHPGMKKLEAQRMMRSILAHGGKGVEVRIHNAKNKLIFDVKRVPASTYDDPFRDAYYNSARIDAGVDYCGSGKFYAIGPGILTHVGTPSHTSTFGDDMMVYQLTDGPAKGKYVFFAEHYNNAPGLKDGQRIDSNTVLGTMNGCIEIGWSDGRGSYAWNSGSYGEGQRSALGDNFSRLMVALGAKPGLTTGRSTSGKLPAGWPTDWRGV